MKNSKNNYLIFKPKNFFYNYFIFLLIFINNYFSPS